MIQELEKKINQKNAKIAVIGLGYVGLPVACTFAQAGFDVLGVEIKPERVVKINAGVSPIEGEEPGLAQLLQKVVQSGKLRASSDYADLADRDVILIDVETPVDEDHIPQYYALRAVLKGLGPVLKTGALVVVESTIAPGTMRDLVCPLLEESSGKRVNRDFFLGNCPERVMPGKLLANLRSLSRVAGGGTPETARAMIALYRHVVQADLDPTDWVTAEVTKTAENAYRDVNIAFANELALICQNVGADFLRVRELVNKSPGRNVLFAGAGVGGHCIPKDPWLLAFGVQGKHDLRLIPAARLVNDSMPDYIISLTKKALGSVGKDLESSKVAVLGYAYLEESDDTRNSPSKVLIQKLDELQVDYVVHDPYVPEYRKDLLESVKGCDAVIIMVAHQAYREMELVELVSALSTPILIDARRVVDSKIAKKTGLYYFGLGLGN